MKKFKKYINEITNVSAGISIRGFGDVSGTPKVGDETEDNPHIERVVQGAEENDRLVKQLLNQYGIVDTMALDFDNVKKGVKNKIKSIINEDGMGAGAVGGGAPVNNTANVAGLTGTPPVSVANQKKHQRRNKIFRRKFPKFVRE